MIFQTLNKVHAYACMYFRNFVPLMNISRKLRNQNNDCPRKFENSTGFKKKILNRRKWHVGMHINKYTTEWMKHKKKKKKKSIKKRFFFLNKIF